MELDQPDVDYVMDLARKQAAEVSNPVKKVKEQRLGGERRVQEVDLPPHHIRNRILSS